MRTKKALKNIIMSLILQVVTIICGFVLPRFILEKFGSEYNGITSSISQFLSCVVLLRAGLGGVTRAALYKPLRDHDDIKISSIMNATEIFMKKIAFIFLGLLIIFSLIYPFWVKEEFSFIFSFSLVLIIGFATFAENYFGITNQILLQADQNYYIISLLSIITTLINTMMSIILIKLGCSIHVVKLVSSIVYTLNPICLNIIVRKKYNIDKNVGVDNSAIKNRWNAFAQQAAVFVNNNTDVMVLSIFCDMKTVSIYTVYCLVVTGVKRLELAMIEAIEGTIGDIIAEGKKEVLQEKFSMFEFFTLGSSYIIFATAGFLLTPFVGVYTKGISDISYYQPIFGYVLCINMFVYCIRIPYDMLISTSGYFGAMRKFAVMESAINIVVSCICMIKFGLIGVVIGTFVALIYGTIKSVIYASRVIIKRKITVFIKKIISFVVAFNVMVFILHILKMQICDSYYDLVIEGIKVFGVAVLTVLFVSLVVFKQEVSNIVRHIKYNLRKR